MGVLSSYDGFQNKLFCKIKKENGNDYLKHFFEVKYSSNYKKYLRSGIVGERAHIQLGKIVSVTIHLGSIGHIERDGHELLNNLLQFYHNEYWLILLWIAMYEKTEGSAIGRELTRAFIKNCISQTSIDLLRNVNNNVTEKHINTSYICDMNNYYKSVFSVKNIVKNMREKKRRKFFRHYKKKKNVKLVKDLKKYGLNSKAALSSLFKQHDLGEFSRLIDLSSSFNDKDGIYGLEVFALIFSRMRAKGKFKAELRQAIQS